MKATLLCISLIITNLVLVTQIGAKIDLETAMGIWLFDENKGAMAKDISGNNNHGQIQVAEWVTGKFGKALKFNGVTSRVVIADSESLYAKKAWTITSWVKVDPSLGGMGYILVKGGGNGINYGLRTSGDGMAWDAFFMEGGAWKGAFNKGKIKKGQWVYMTATYDGVNEIRVYEMGRGLAQPNEENHQLKTTRKPTLEDGTAIKENFFMVGWMKWRFSAWHCVKMILKT